MEAKETLFSGYHKPVDLNDLSRGLEKSGIMEGKTVFLHTQLLSFGRIAKSTADAKDHLFSLICGSLREAVGKSGTILMTTFSYRTLQSGKFDRDLTPSEGGALTEYFRKQPGVQRSLHPTHSFAVSGAESRFYLDIDNSTFGKGSVYGKLYERNATLLFLGAPFYYCTFNHFIEEMGHVPYRNCSTRNMMIKDGDRKWSMETKVYSKSDRYRINFNRFEKKLLEKGILKAVPLGDGTLLSINARDLFNEGIQILEKEPYFFVDVESLPAFMFRRAKQGLKNLLQFTRLFPRSRKA